MDIVIVLLMLMIGFLAFGLYKKTTNGICKSKTRLDGKTCLVTGGTSGIGLHIATDFAMRGARVIVACPFEEEGSAAQKVIIQESGNGNVVFKHLDLSSLNSVRQFASEILHTEDRLDVLMNNAGVGIPQKMTADNMNIIMQVNYFGHFLLTLLLLPLLKKSGTSSEPSRIVNTTSILHYAANLDVNNLNKDNLNLINRIRMYGNSKLCLLLFSNELTKRLQGAHVVINDADPGETGTRIYLSFNFISGIFLQIFLSFLCNTSWEGAQTPILLAVDDKLASESGSYYRNCQKVKPSNRAKDEKLAKRIWDESLRIVKLSDDEIRQLS